MEDPLEEQSEKKAKKKIEMIVVRLFQDENAPGPRLKPREKNVNSLLNKDGEVISHEYRRERRMPRRKTVQPQTGRAKDALTSHQEHSKKRSYSSN